MVVAYFRRTWISACGYERAVFALGSTVAHRAGWGVGIGCIGATSGSSINGDLELLLVFSWQEEDLEYSTLQTVSFCLMADVGCVVEEVLPVGTSSQALPFALDEFR